MVRGNRGYLVLALLLLALLVLVPWLWARAIIGVLVLFVLSRVSDSSSADHSSTSCDSALSPRLTSFRHALLNDLQLVSGYVQLGRSSEHILSKVDLATERTRQMGRIFGLNEWDLSCYLFDIWEEASELGVNLTVTSSGSFAGFIASWPDWKKSLTAAWTYYKGQAQEADLTEATVELRSQESHWLISFVPEAPLAPEDLPESLRGPVANSVEMLWDNERNRLTMRVDKT